MTKEQIVQKLTDLGIKFDIAEKKAVLYALLPESVRLEIEKTETPEQKVETTTADPVPVQAIPVTPEPPKLSEKEIARIAVYAKLVAQYKALHPAAYDARVASGEDFTKIPASFQGLVELVNGKERIY